MLSQLLPLWSNDVRVYFSFFSFSLFFSSSFLYTPHTLFDWARFVEKGGDLSVTSCSRTGVGCQGSRGQAVGLSGTDAAAR